MKKILFGKILCVLMSAAVIIHCAAALTDTVQADEIRAEASANEVKVFTTKNASVLIAQYNENYLTAIEIKNATANGDNTYPVVLSEWATEYKVFVLNNLVNLQPLCETSVYKPPYIDDVITAFDGEEFNYPVLLVNDEPCMEIGELSKVTGGTAEGNTLTVGDVKLTYTENSRLAETGGGHLMLENAPQRIGGRLYVPLSSLIPATGWTVEYKRFDKRIVIETGTNYPEPERTVYAKDFSTVGDGIEDDRDAILAAFNEAAGSGVPTKLELEEGKTYRISEKQDSFALFDLDDISNLTIEGNRSTILFERPANSLINIERCINVKVKNINVSYLEPVTTYGVIKSVDVQGGAFEMEIPENVPLPADNEWAWFWNTGEGPYVFGQVMDKTEDRMKFLTFDHLWINKITKISDRNYRVEIKNPSTGNMNQIETGDRFVYKSRWTAYDFGEVNKYGRPDFICVTSSKDITFDGVKTNGSLLMFAPVSNNDGRIIFRNCELQLADNALVTTNADGIHATSNRFGVIVENCIFTNSLDDFINTNQHAGEVTAVSDNSTFVVNKDLYYRVGDKIQFFNKESHSIIGTAYLKAVKETEEGGYQLTLDREVEGVLASGDSDNPTLVYNLSAANNGNIIRNNRFLNSRRHAYIIRAANTLVENNYMENNGGASLEAANEIYGTSNEGAFPSALTIKGNIITGDGITSGYHPLRIYSWEALNTEQKAIDGVLLENNVIDVKSAKGSIRISHVNDLYMLNNSITCGDELKAVSPVVISNSKVKLFDGLDYAVTKGNTAVSFTSCDIDENNIKNIKSVGGVAITPYEIR